MTDSEAEHNFRLSRPFIRVESKPFLGGGRRPLTGITEPALLRASPIVPWADCTDAQRLDVHNGLLLSALWDAAFDKGLVSFTDDGTVCVSTSLSESARRALGVATVPQLTGLRAAHLANLAAHRARHGF
jgi:putative restriction endonuclease